MVVKLPIPISQIEAFCRRWQIRELSLFGSILRKDFGPDSDIDVLVVFEDGAAPGLEAWLDMHDELRAMFGRDVDLVEKQRPQNPYRRHHILTNRQIVYGA
ncbi:MAG: nucleotidyltransferase family protein [Phycisphaerales bacterium JB039]